jgi:hypothetical protein
MGAADVSGESNVYVEDSTFTLALHEAIDGRQLPPGDSPQHVDNPASQSQRRHVVDWRRHVGIYNNTFIFTNR